MEIKLRKRPVAKLTKKIAFPKYKTSSVNSIIDEMDKEMSNNGTSLRLTKFREEAIRAAYGRNAKRNGLELYIKKIKPSWIKVATEDILRHYYSINKKITDVDAKKAAVFIWNHWGPLDV